MNKAETTKISPKRVSVFIDADNMPPKILPQVIKFVKTQGEIHFFKIYGNDHAIFAWDKIIKRNKKNTFEIQTRTNGLAKKNSSDIAIAIDCIEILIKNKTDIFCIVSCDADFIPVINRIKENRRKKVLVVTSQAMGKHLVDVAHQSMVIDMPQGKFLSKEALRTLLVKTTTAIIRKHGHNGFITGSELGGYLKKYNCDWKKMGCKCLNKVIKRMPEFRVTALPNGLYQVSLSN